MPIMKNIILIILTIIIGQNIFCQTAVSQILPLSTKPSHYIENVYLKDLNNILNSYTGTWEGIQNNRKYTFIVTKFAQNYNDFGKYFKDELMVKFRVTNMSNGTIIYDNLSAITYDQYNVMGTTPHKGLFNCYFTDSEFNCKNAFEFTLKDITGNPNQKKYCYFAYQKSWNPLSNGNYCYDNVDRMSLPIYLPTEDLILTKQ